MDHIKLYINQKQYKFVLNKSEMLSFSFFFLIPQHSMMMMVVIYTLYATIKDHLYQKKHDKFENG